MLSRSSQRHVRTLQRSAAGEEVAEPAEPPVSILLDVGWEYRKTAEKDQLQTIAAIIFNPIGEKWLPILHTEREEWNFTVLFSNTKRAHDLKKTHEWVVIYYEQNDEEGQCTVVTRALGTLKDKRVIRGREDECREFYEEKSVG